jgi:hypothetical protein
MTSASEPQVSVVVGLDNVPDGIRAAAAMAEPDYVDVVTITTGGVVDLSPEQWARTALEDTPTGRGAPRLWRLLGLRLGPRPSPDHVQGWRIADRGDDWIRLEVSSWLMTGHAVVHVGDGTVSLALFLRFDQAVAHVIWPPVSVTHRRALPVMLRQALKAARTTTRPA